MESLIYKTCQNSNSNILGIINKSSSPHIEKLNNIRDQHSIWENKFLTACATGDFTREDFAYIFGQYYFYSKNFTKFLAAGMINCDNDYYRAKLSQNLWEEGGGQEIELRHSELFRKFLVDGLNISLEEIQFETFTKYFVQNLLTLCINSSPAACAAILSFGVESIVARVYNILKQGLLQIGFSEEQLLFFNLHIACDDDHAFTLQEMALSYAHEELWFEHCSEAILTALDLRDKFFAELYQATQRRKFNDLIDNISFPNETTKTSDSQLLKSNITATNEQLYQNKAIEKNINFIVRRIPFRADVLDPRLVNIPAGFCNELHSHAHETVFLILSGTGAVVVDDQIISIQAGDLIYVPRWSKHQTQNTGIDELIFFAITDYGLTKRLSKNSESVYRLNTTRSN